MDLTKLQLSELMCKHAAKGNGLHDLMEIMIESMMVAERGEFLADNPGNKGTGCHRPPLCRGGGKLYLLATPARPGPSQTHILFHRDRRRRAARPAGFIQKGVTKERGA